MNDADLAMCAGCIGGPHVRGDHPEACGACAMIATARACEHLFVPTSTQGVHCLDVCCAHCGLERHNTLPSPGWQTYARPS
jgi:hypothetical protein